MYSICSTERLVYVPCYINVYVDSVWHSTSSQRLVHNLTSSNLNNGSVDCGAPLPMSALKTFSSLLVYAARKKKKKTVRLNKVQPLQNSFNKRVF